jgi:hypothetical protein
MFVNCSHILLLFCLINSVFHSSVIDLYALIYIVTCKYFCMNVVMIADHVFNFPITLSKIEADWVSFLRIVT